MRENELIKAIDSVYGISKDKYNKEPYYKKNDNKVEDSDFNVLLKSEEDKLRKEQEEKQEQLKRLREGKAYISILHNVYEESKITRNR